MSSLKVNSFLALKGHSSERVLLVPSGSLDPMTQDGTDGTVGTASTTREFIADSVRHFRLHILKFNVHVKTSNEKKIKESF